MGGARYWHEEERQRTSFGGEVKDSDLDLRSSTCLCWVLGSRLSDPWDINVWSSEKMSGLPSEDGV